MDKQQIEYGKQFAEWVVDRNLQIEELVMMNPEVIVFNITGEYNEDFAAVVEEMIYGKV